MDPALQPSTPQNTLSTMPTSSGKRSRENESPSQRHKREKAAERQRRKRERDRNANLQNDLVGIAAAQQPPQQHPPPPVIAAVTHPQQPLPTAPAQSALPPITEPFAPTTNELSAAELSRRERVRSAARERQRKHRALVKQKKLRELGLDMGNELGVQGLEDMQYRIATEGAPFGALQHDLGQQPLPGQPDPAFPPGHHGGQTFASTLLLSFSCAPLLKQHILRTLSMTNEELASLEPIIAQAWDQWDHQRRIHYAHQAQAAVGAGKPPDGHPLGEVPPPPAPFAATVDMGDAQVAPPPFPPTDPNQPPQANDFRARFHRSLVAPSPFRSFAPPQPSAPADGIDPHLGAEQSPKAAVAAATAAAAAVASAIDPKLGQARGEAEGVVGRLERG
ncbi:hypothetical protein EDB85DRAFT_1944114 [Lactarius pseudohatsudake]|nr:hypothetical protein EDB85DRAFT_2038836 [Lactarius pseudohatsudake]KAH9035581.1 hypothetical protein EDB85DRAFT_1944114 [Lactarius pseudohatsudake]